MHVGKLPPQPTLKRQMHRRRGSGLSCLAAGDVMVHRCNFENARYTCLIYSTICLFITSSQQHQSQPMLLTRWSRQQPLQPTNRTVPTEFEPCGPGLKITPLFDGTGAQLVSQCSYDHHGLGWQLALKV